MKNTLQRINSRFDKSKDQISSLEEYIAENSSSEQQKWKKKESWNTWGQFKEPLEQHHANVYIIRVPEEEREQGIENLFEGMMIETSLTWQIDIKAQEAQSPKHDEFKYTQTKTHHN